MIVLWLRGTLGLFFLVNALWIICLNNFVIPLRWHIKKEHGSLLPLLGGVFGMLALFLLPVPALHKWWWIPLVVDLGCAPLMLATLADQLWRWFKNKGTTHH